MSELELIAYFAERDVAVRDVLAYRAAPPEYPDLALVPVEALERLARYAPLPSRPDPVASEGLTRNELAGDPDDLMQRLATEGDPRFADLAGRAYIRIRTLQAAFAAVSTPMKG